MSNTSRVLSVELVQKESHSTSEDGIAPMQCGPEGGRIGGEYVEGGIMVEDCKRPQDF